MNLTQKILSTMFLVCAFLLTSSVLYLIYAPSQQSERAQHSLAVYLNKLGLESTNSACNKDSDGDGYSSCAYNNGKKVINLECDSALLMNTDTCKKPKHMF